MGGKVSKADMEYNTATNSFRHARTKKAKSDRVKAKSDTIKGKSSDILAKSTHMVL